MKTLLSVLFICLATICFADSISDKTSNFQKLPGFFNLYWDQKNGKLYLEIDKLETEFLYINSLPAGVGSNDIGLDRGQIGENRIVYFWRSGPKVLLIQPNYNFRAETADALEKKAVQESFAQSVLWGFTATAEEKGRILVDATDFFVRDAHSIARQLKETKQGDFKLDAARSAIYMPATKNFPQNTEVETLLTFAGDSPGNFVQQVVPAPQNITVRLRHSFVQLPPPGYKPREYDPRAGFFGISFMDYATPISEPIRKRWIARHRLEKKNPPAAVSDVVEPIVYYLDPGVPEPIRTALLEGARWWGQAFEAAGFRNAYRVEMLPEGADPLDVRYNVIEWVHRATRGWSYGNAVVDPRTGEIIKGHVSLGSLRVRQDYMIAEGLLAPYESGKPLNPEMAKMALARLRQLSAHEVGHTLGISHNYIASISNRASVMDYPHPLVSIREDGSLDLSDAYSNEIGAWDKLAVEYGYRDFPDGTDEKKALNAIIEKGISQKLIFLSDQDARPDGSAHPYTHLWDNGTNAVDELNRVMKIRSTALERFSEQNIREHAPMSTLEEVLVPIYLFHRYQLIAAAKVLGGLEYTYALRGDQQKTTSIVSAAEQRRALKSLLSTLDSQALALPERIIQLIPPRPDGYDRDREMFQIKTGLTFDPLSASETAAQMTVNLILHPDRAARLIEYHARDKNNPDFIEVTDALISATWKSARGSGLNAEIRRAIDSIVLSRLMWLSANEKARTQVRAVAALQIENLRKWISGQITSGVDQAQKAHLQFALDQIEQFQQDPSKVKFTVSPEPPAGAPIGSLCDY